MSVTRRPLPVRLSGYLRVIVKSRNKRQAPFILLGLIVALLLATPVLAAGSVSAKQAEARQVLAEIQQMDVQLEKAIEAYDASNVRLDEIHAQMKVNRYELFVARHNLRHAETQLAARLKAIYVSGEDTKNSTLEILLGSRSLDDVINSIDTVNRVSSEDTSVLGQVKQYRVTVQRTAVALKRANKEQSVVVAQRAATKADIEAGLARRQTLLSSIKGEIVRLQAEERARQAQLRREAAARLSAQQRQEQQALQNTVVGAAAVTPEGATVAPPSQYGGAVGIAMQFLGTPYVWGGGSPGGFDCSGLVEYVYAQLGVSLPHNAAAQFNYGVPVSQSDLQPGDLVFFDGLGHVGLYIGGGQFIHAPHTGDVVKISSLSDSWYAATYVGARRIIP
jgi:peptidoglycan DL-endopeptidase CwlO